MPTTRKKIIKTVYKDENSDEEGGDFSDSGSDAIISEASSSDDDIVSEPTSSEDEPVDEQSFNNSKRQYSTKKKFKRTLPRKIINQSWADTSENVPAFSIKDLTEADKLLPSILNLSESDSSDEESQQTFNTSSFTLQQTDQDDETEKEVPVVYKNVFSNLKQVQDDGEEIAKKTFMELEQHKSKIEETKATLQNYTIKVQEQESDVKDLLALGEDVLTPGGFSGNKKSKLKRRNDDSDSDMEDWEEVKESKSVPQQGIQLIVEFPETTNRRKPKTIDVEMMMKRKINRVKKEYQVYMHKVHVLCWLGHGNYVNNVLNDRGLMAAALSLVPSKERRPKNKVDMNYIEQIMTCYKDLITLKLNKNEDKFKPKAPHLKTVLLDLIKKKVVTSKKYLIYIFVVLLRALGLQCRVMFNFVTLPIKPPATELCSLSNKPSDKKAKISQKENIMTDKTTESITTTGETENKTKPKRNNRRTKPTNKNIVQVDGIYDMSSGDEIMELKNKSYCDIYCDYENIMQVDGADDKPTIRRTRSNKRQVADVVENIKDENISPSKKPRLNLSRASLKPRVTCNEHKNLNLSKAKNVKSTVTKQAKDNLENDNFKDLTNVTPKNVNDSNTTLSKPPRKSPRHTTQEIVSQHDEMKDFVVQKRTPKNLKTLDINMKSKTDDNVPGALKIVEENISSLTRKRTKRNAAVPLTERNKNDNIELSDRARRGVKTVGSKVKHPSETYNNNPSGDVMVAAEICDTEIPPKRPRKSQRHNKTLDITEMHDPDNNTNEISHSTLASSKNLTRSQKNKLANNCPIKQPKNDLKTEKKNTNTLEKNRPKTFLINDKKPKVPRIILTRESHKDISSKNDENTKSHEVQSRMTRTRSEKANPSESMNNIKKESIKAKSAKRGTKSAKAESSSLAMEENTENETQIKNRKKSRKEQLSEDKQIISGKIRTRNSKHEETEVTKESKNQEKVSKSATKRKSVKGQIKQETEADEDYSPLDDPKQHNSDSDDSFKPTKISLKAKTVRRIDRRVLSSSTEGAISKKNRIDIWCEVFVEELGEWISIDIVSGKVKSTKEIYANATQPVCYVVGWENKNYLKDLTRKYVPHFNTETRKIRVDPLWFNKAVSSYIGPKTARDKQEDEYLDKMQLEAPLPTVIGEYKNHPLYVLKRHLLKFEAIYPPDATVLGFVRGEPVYARECVYVCRSRNIWYKKHAKVVKLGEKAYKMVKAQPRWDKINRKIITDDPPMEIFGPWQVEDFVPPVAENGIVPRNEYGNVELFKECMLPKGTVHLKLPGLNRIAKKLNIDCATAITGFEVNHGWVRPVYEGFVVCQEFEDIITEAWADDQEEQERKELERTELRVYGNWKRLIKGLLIRERLKNKYGFEEPKSKSGKGVKEPKHVARKKRK